MIGLTFLALIVQIYRTLHGKGGSNSGSAGGKSGGGFGGGGGGMGNMFG